MPASGASASSKEGAAEIRSVSEAAARGSTVSTVVFSLSARLRRACSKSLACARPSAAIPEDALEASTRQAILVVHGGLMHQIAQRPLCFRTAIAKKDQVVAPQDRDRSVIGRHVHDQPVGRMSQRAPCQDRVDDIEGCQVDESSVRSDLAAQFLVLMHDIPFRDRYDELLTVDRPLTCRVADLCVVDGEGRGFLHLPPDQPIQILLARGHVLEADQRYLGDGIRDDQADAPRPAADPVEHMAERPQYGRAIVDIRGRQRRHERPVRQRLGRIGRDDRPSAAEFQTGGRHAVRGHFDRHRWRSRLAQWGQDIHSTNVTLLISRSVVVPCITRSTADSRRNRIPSSRAAFLISAVDRFSRIISRM